MRWDTFSKLAENIPAKDAQCRSEVSDHAEMNVGASTVA
jgi:hypothetical protein